MIEQKTMAMRGLLLRAGAASAVFFLGLAVYSCDKGNLSSEAAPTLRYKSAVLKYKPAEIDPTVRVYYCEVTLEFSDGSGDIGWSSSERETFFPKQAIAPQKSYEDYTAEEVYPVLNESYKALQKAYYDTYFPDEQYAVFDDTYTYESMKWKYVSLVADYERIMQKEYYSLIVEYFEGDKVKTVRLDLNFSSALPPLGGYVPNGTMARGDIVYDINLSERLNDTVSFSFVLRDRAKNTSPKITTPVIILPKAAN